MEAGRHTQSPDRSEFNGLAIAATNHCLTGCAIGEVAGMGLATAVGWGNVAQTSLAIVLAYFFGFLLVAIPLIRARLEPRTIVSTAVASETVSITIMEVIANLILILIPMPWAPAWGTRSSTAALRPGSQSPIRSPSGPTAGRSPVAVDTR